MLGLSERHHALGDEVVPDDVHRRLCSTCVRRQKAEGGGAVVQGQVAPQMRLLPVRRCRASSGAIALLYGTLQIRRGHACLQLVKL